MKETGGPAFPIANAEASMYASCLEDLASPNLDTAEQAHLSAKATALCGMTLRDYFAAKAMQGILSGLSSNKEMAMLAQNAWHKKGQTDYEYVTEQAHKYADAMLKAREQ